MAARVKPQRRVHVQRGQTLEVHAGAGCVVKLERFPSGAVQLRNGITGSVLRSWAPKEARSR